MARIGIYGGSFNPIHFGHIGLVNWTLVHTDLDAIWLMVTPNNPLKSVTVLTDEHVRYQQVKEKVKNIQGVEVSDFEFHLPRPSYTANTLKELTRTYPEHQFALIIGQDNWQIRHKWREWEYIETNHPIYIYPREGSADIDELDLPGNAHFLREAPLFNISSTQIRESQGQETIINKQAI